MSTVRMSSDGPRIGGKLFASVFFLVFLAFGLGFAVPICRGIAATLRMRAWTASECTVLASGVEEHPGAAEADESYRFTVTYRYEAGGRRYESSRYKPGYAGSSDVTSARRLAAAHPFGARVPCWVDPRDPGSATLVRSSPWGALALLFPLAFAAVGAGGLAFVWGLGPFARRGGGATDPTAAPGPISQRNATPRWLPGCLVAFFGVFLCVGLGVGTFFVRPALQVLAARSWQPTPCTVLYSAVRTHPGDKGSTYSMDVLYVYYVGGREHRSSRFEFMGGSSGGYDRYVAAAGRYPAGSRAVCYADPADPEEAVLERGFDRQYWIGIVPLVFTLVGAGGIFFVLRGFGSSRKPAPGTLDWLPSRTAAIAPATGPVELRPAGTPLGKLLGILFACLFWNGIVSVFLWQLVQGWRNGSRDFGLALFLVPFVLVGLLLVWGVAYQLLALANPRPHLTLAPATLALGATAQLDWRFRGLSGRIRHLRITLEGREEATFRRGTTTSTDRDTFAVVEIFDTALAPAIPAGSAGFSVPAGTMHTFAAPHNRIVWTLKVQGEIRGWPDVAEDFDLAILPPEAIS